MALRFFADHYISNFIIQTLQDAKHEILRLKDLLPVESSDAVVIAKAQEISAILLSLNGDFVDIVTYPPQRYKGIVALRLHNHAESSPISWPDWSPTSIFILIWSITAASWS